MVNARHWLPQFRERVYMAGLRSDLAAPPMNWSGLCYDTMQHAEQGDQEVRAAPAAIDRLVASHHAHWLRSCVQLPGLAAVQATPTVTNTAAHMQIQIEIFDFTTFPSMKPHSLPHPKDGSSI